ncbi:hypothetical protein [Streptomyces glycanivorans]|uniref:Lipoprotein n=1 Tax=Streptomyces glycanivorans TaxID=3033808 RepID=A0ABY9J9T9_9ACTN|nr:hypothetical protein [Streptomyces sp. Alt3]WLQ64448.1 hypothetical protein P8A20_12970 [Streptomyces sp. Alt3]
MRAAMTRIRFKGAAVAAAAVAMAVVLTACGGDDGADEPESKPQGSSSSSSEQESEKPAPDEVDESQILATVKGSNGVEVVVNSAARESGGFVTVKGTVTNGSEQSFSADGWQGGEQELVNNHASVAGASLVDQQGKKRYLILRDTDGKCLCTRFVGGIAAGAEAPFFAQFPAPPQSTTEVDFQIPTMPTATIKISG